MEGSVSLTSFLSEISELSGRECRFKWYSSRVPVQHFRDLFYRSKAQRGSSLPWVDANQTSNIGWQAAYLEKFWNRELDGKCSLLWRRWSLFIFFTTGFDHARHKWVPVDYSKIAFFNKASLRELWPRCHWWLLEHWYAILCLTFSFSKPSLSRIREHCRFLREPDYDGFRSRTMWVDGSTYNEGNC